MEADRTVEGGELSKKGKHGNYVKNLVRDFIVDYDEKQDYDVDYD